MLKISKRNKTSAQAFKARPVSLRPRGGEEDYRPGYQAKDSPGEGVASQEDGEDFVPHNSGSVTGGSLDPPEDLNSKTNNGEGSKIQQPSNRLKKATKGKGLDLPGRKTERVLSNRVQPPGKTENSHAENSSESEAENWVSPRSNDQGDPEKFNWRLRRFNNEKEVVLSAPHTIEVVDGELSHISHGDYGNQFLRLLEILQSPTAIALYNRNLISVT